MSGVPGAVAPPAEVCRRIFRLVHELCELGNDPVQWNTRLLQGLEELVGAEAGIACIFPTAPDPANVSRPLTVFHRTEDPFNEFVESGDYRANPATPAVMARFGTDWVATRRDLVDDETWYASPAYRRIFEPAGVDDHIISQVCVGSLDRVHHIAAIRRTGAEPFGRNDCEIIRFLHQELAYLWRKPEAVEIDSLPKRLLETVGGMRKGLSRKQIADELQISAHTVHTYERQLFEKFDVKGRGELLARLAKAIRPALKK